MAASKFFGGLVIVVVCCVVSARADEAPEPAAADSSAARTLRQITTDVRQNLRAQALAESASQQEVAVRQLIRLHGEVVEHEMFASSDTFQRTLRRVRERLREVAKELRDSGGIQPMTSHRATKTPARPAHARPPNAVLAQQLPVNRPVPQGGFGQPLVGPPIVGPPIPAANGLALVDLIERTISPPIWEVNGGPASIVYFAPRHVLVVRAPGPAHRDVVRLVNGLRQAGR